MSNLSLRRTWAFVAALAIGVAVGGCASKNELTTE
jgi:hypothetical protein